MLLFLMLLVHAPFAKSALANDVEKMEELTERLALTDLCIFTEARYTRNPSLADLHSAFQDHPVSMEHFPSGSFVAPPAHLIGERAHGMD
jgi:hypothetical protein